MSSSVDLLVKKEEAKKVSKKKSPFVIVDHRFGGRKYPSKTTQRREEKTRFVVVEDEALFR